MTEREQIFADAIARQAKRSLEWAAAVEPIAFATRYQQTPEQGEPRPQRKQGARRRRLNDAAGPSAHAERQGMPHHHPSPGD